MDKQQQRELIRRAKDGDIDAFVEVFEDLRPVAFRIASRIVGPDEADDVVSDSYLKAWRALPNFDERASARTWIFRIVHNCALDVLRSRKRRKEQVMPDNEQDDRTIEDLHDTSQPAAPDQIVRQETIGLVQRALAELDDLHRLPLQLRYSDDLSYADIASTLGISIGTVMSRLFNGKRKLKRIISELDG